MSNLRNLTLLCLFSILTHSSTASTSSDSFIVGDVRVEVLSSTLVRLEVKGPQGFVNVPTFQIVNRNWPGTKAFETQSGNDIFIHTTKWNVEVPKDADSLTGISITSLKGTLLWSYTSLPGNHVSLPDVESDNRAWAIADTPRMIAPKWGYDVAPPGSPYPSTNGWDLENDSPDMYVFLTDGNTRELRAEFNRLTGRTGMVPLHALGAWDSRYHEYTEKTAIQQVKNYRSHHFPLDNLVVDTNWRIGGSTGYDANPKDFPDLKRFFREAHANHVFVMFNDHPVSVGPALSPPEVALRNAGTRKILSDGLDVWWFDRNWMYSLAAPPGFGKTSWGTYIYSWIMSDFYPQRRMLTMSNVDGLQPELVTHRYPIQWTGDIITGSASLKHEIENAVNEGVYADYPYTSSDLGGFNGDPTPDGYVRWLEYGSLSPILRVHVHYNGERMPWVFGPQAETITRRYYRMRYRLLPFLYELAHHNYETGVPILKRCDFDYPAYKEASNPDQYLLGKGVLVAPIAGVRVNTVPSSWLKTPDGSPGLQGEYFSNTTLSGTPAVTRTDKNVNFVWSGGTPAPGIPQTNFTVRWKGSITVGAKESIELSVKSDDGVRLFVDGKKVLDDWGPQDSTSITSKVALAPGTTHTVELDYLQLGGNALCRLGWNRAAKQAGTSSRSVWIPPGTWTDVWTGMNEEGPKTIVVRDSLQHAPIFIRQGTIVPLAPQMDYTSQKPWDPITVDVYPSASGSATGSLYEDDTISNGYRYGQFRITPFHEITSSNGSKITVIIDSSTGTFKGAIQRRSWVLRIHALNQKPKSVTLDGKHVHWKMVNRNPNGMPFAETGGSPDSSVLVMSIPNGPVSHGHTLVITL